MGSRSRKTSSNNSAIRQNRRIRLLLVDDEKEFLKVLSNRLRKRGVEVETASSGAKGIQSLRRADFDVAVVDLKMEDMGGIEVLQIFKKMAPEIPIIILTGHGSEEALMEGMTSGAYDYLMKPCDIDELLTKVKEAAEVDDHKDDNI